MQTGQGRFYPFFRFRHQFDAFRAGLILAQR